VSSPLPNIAGTPPAISVRELGLQLAGPHAATLLVIGILLTVALLGGVMIASTDKGDSP
jgi:hypothetical protein